MTPKTVEQLRAGMDALPFSVFATYVAGRLDAISGDWTVTLFFSDGLWRCSSCA